MKMHPMTAARAKKKGGFSLIELLTVLAIVAIMASLVLGFSRGILAASHLKNGGKMLNDYLGFARQTAITKNRPVEFRLYSLPVSPGSAISTYRAFQIFTVQDGGDVPETKVLYFPQNVHLFADSAKSSLIPPGSYAPLSQTPTIPLPNVGLDYSYVMFHFAPTGGTDLDPTKQWFVTIVEDPLNNMGKFPANFFTVQVDPTLGKVSIFQP